MQEQNSRETSSENKVWILLSLAERTDGAKSINLMTELKISKKGVTHTQHRLKTMIEDDDKGQMWRTTKSRQYIAMLVLVGGRAV